jgi:tryptophanyl-tRNA synthetase
MRPTGRLQIGNYFGALQNWVRLQNEVLPSTESVGSSSPLATRHSPLPANDCFYFVADWHALTSDYADTSAIAENTLQVAIDFLAAGLDPQKSVIFLQSQVPEHAELHLLLSMITPLGWLERVPTYKEALDNIKNKDLHTYGFLGYPTLQTADIVMYSDPGKALIVPVGEDQVAHVEMSRELTRKFNYHYGLSISPELFDPEHGDALAEVESVLGTPQFPFVEDADETLEELWEMNIRYRIEEDGIQNFIRRLDRARLFITCKEILVPPQELLTPTPRVPGLDGRKMSKSYGNAITLSESDADIRSKTKVMVTDPARKRRTDPGNPDICPVYDWHKLFSTPERDPGRLDWVQTGCRTAGIGCIECKSAMADNLIQWITPIRARRLEYEQHPKRVLEILHSGSAQARREAAKTMDRVRQAVFHWSDKERQLGFPPPRN